MHRIDRALCNSFDACAAWAQRHGYNLLAIRVYWSFAVLVSSLTQAIYFSRSTAAMWTIIALDAVVFGGLLGLRVREFNQNRDYPETVRIMQRLNAEALRQRETQAGFRVVFMIFFAINIVVFSFAQTLANTLTDSISYSALLGMWYLDTCTYLGPGEHSRKRQESGSEEAIKER